MIFLLSIHLFLRAVDEHKALKTGYYSQIKVKYDKKQNLKFIEYVEQCSKNHQGGTKDFKKNPKVVTAYQNVDQPAHCIVCLYEKYIGLHPSHDPKCSHDLYLCPLKCYSQHVWYSCQPIGINTLQQVTSKLANMANLGGKRTNHSLCATGPTSMYERGMDEKLVRELTGHHSNAVLEYKHTSTEMKNHVSQVLYGNEVSHVPQRETKSSESLSKRSVQDFDCDPSFSQMPVKSQKVFMEEPTVPMSQSSQGFTMNYNVSPQEKIGPINVYPIINILNGLQPGTPVIINVNINMPK